MSPFADLPQGHFKAIYADPPWAYKTHSGDAIPARASRNGLATAHYQTMPIKDICALPVAGLAADDCCFEAEKMKHLMEDCAK